MTTKAKGASIHSYPLLADLRAAKGLDSLADGDRVSIGGHTVHGVGGGEFWYDANGVSAADNNINTIVTVGGTCLKRVGGVLDFDMAGAVGDGVTDDYAVIQAAVATGMNFSVGSRRYFLSQAVELVTSGQELTGIQSTGIKRGAFISAGTQPCFKLLATGVKVSGFVVEGEGTHAADVTSTDGALIRILADACEVSYIHAEAWRYAIEARGVSNAHIHHNTGRNGLTVATDTNATAGQFIDVRTDDDTQVSNNIVEYNDVEWFCRVGMSPPFFSLINSVFY